MELKPVIIYTDGGCRNNQEDTNIGGCAAILMFNGRKKKVSKGYRNTTNNKMEIQAVIEGLKHMKRKDVPIKLYSDSSYVVNTISKGWLVNWAKNGWVKKDGKNVKNMEQWEELLQLIRSFDDFKIYKVKGHDVDILNNEVDDLVNKIMDKMENN